MKYKTDQCYYCKKQFSHLDWYGFELRENSMKDAMISRKSCPKCAKENGGRLNG